MTEVVDHQPGQKPPTHTRSICTCHIAHQLWKIQLLFQSQLTTKTKKTKLTVLLNPFYHVTLGQKSLSKSEAQILNRCINMPRLQASNIYAMFNIKAVYLSYTLKKVFHPYHLSLHKYLFTIVIYSDAWSWETGRIMWRKKKVSVTSKGGNFSSWTVDK